jgi:hypothetical protein
MRLASVTDFTKMYRRIAVPEINELQHIWYFLQLKNQPSNGRKDIFGQRKDRSQVH